MWLWQFQCGLTQKHTPQCWTSKGITVSCTEAFSIAAWSIQQPQILASGYDGVTGLPFPWLTLAWNLNSFSPPAHFIIHISIPVIFVLSHWYNISIIITTDIRQAPCPATFKAVYSNHWHFLSFETMCLFSFGISHSIHLINELFLGFFLSVASRPFVDIKSILSPKVTERKELN